MPVMSGEDAQVAVFALGCRPDSVGQYTNLDLGVQEKHFIIKNRRQKMIAFH
jgi:hypothetical protein